MFITVYYLVMYIIIKNDKALLDLSLLSLFLLISIYAHNNGNDVIRHFLYIVVIATRIFLWRFLMHSHKQLKSTRFEQVLQIIIYTISGLAVLLTLITSLGLNSWVYIILDGLILIITTLCLVEAVNCLKRNINTKTDIIKEIGLLILTLAVLLVSLRSFVTLNVISISLGVIVFAMFTISLAFMSANALRTQMSQNETKDLELVLYREIINKTSVGVMIADSEFTILDVNDAFVVMTEKTKEELIGEKAIDFYSELHDEKLYKGIEIALENELQWHGEIWDKTISDKVKPRSITINKLKKGMDTIYVSFSLDISDQKDLESKLHKRAYYDHLTGLPNRALFFMSLEKSINKSFVEGTKSALFFLDLDGFKGINDQYGHDAGDHVLIEIGRRLKKILRGSDEVYRLAGDEFTIIFNDIGEYHDIDQIIERVKNVVTEPINYMDNILSTNVSIGVAKIVEDGTDVSTILNKADKAMYQMKRN